MLPDTMVTERLTLRRPVLDDADAIFTRYAQDPDVTKHLLWKPHESVVDTRAFVATCMRDWDLGISRFAYVVTLQHGSDDRVIGMAEVTVCDEVASLGYVLARSHWGKGYATEASRALVHELMECDAVRRIEAVTEDNNVASQRVLEKIGLAREEFLPGYYVRPERGAADVWMFGITKRAARATRDFEHIFSEGSPFFEGSWC
ncbi:MAG: GNAT family N-acetyltransferase [Myxococcota bacterium]